MLGAIEYTVKPGDSLSKIAMKYGRPATDWKKIWNLNLSKIKNPDLIYPGWKIEIPVNWDEKRAAVTSSSPVSASILPVLPIKTNAGKFIVIAGVIALAYYATKKKWF